MKVEVPVIKKETKDFFRSELNKLFTVKEGTGLQEIAAEILNDKELHHFFVSYLKEGYGLQLGKMWFWSDIRVDVPYGLTVDFKNLPRKMYFFEFYEVLGDTSWKDLHLLQGFPTRVQSGIATESDHYYDIPSSEELVDRLNGILDSKPREHVIKLPVKEDIKYLLDDAVTVE